MNAANLIDAIDHAFAGVPRPATSLRQFRLTDVKGMAGNIAGDEWAEAGRNRGDEVWQEISDSELEECDVVLSHMQAAEFRYYLPACMRYAVRRVQSPGRDSDILGMTVSALCPSRRDSATRHYTLSQLSLFDHAQRRAIVEFLKFVARHAAYVQRPYAMEALEHFWTSDVVRDGIDTSVIITPR